MANGGHEKKARARERSFQLSDTCNFRALYVVDSRGAKLITHEIDQCQRCVAVMRKYISIRHKNTQVIMRAPLWSTRCAYARPISIQLSLYFFYDSYLVPVSPPSHHPSHRNRLAATFTIILVSKFNVLRARLLSGLS